MPSWLARDEGADSEIVLSSRVRLMRNLAGHRFPNAAATEENLAVLAEVLSAAEGYEVFPSLTKVERDHYVGTRLLSPDFSWTQPGRAVLLDRDRSTAVLVNEEDHLRLQVVLSGSQWETALRTADHAVAAIEARLPFAQTEKLGYLAASVYNCGSGRRISAMLHLIGLVTSNRIAVVLPALNSGRIVFRGLFGESSRAVGAFAQVSTIAGNADEFRGALLYLLAEEAQARAEMSADALTERCRSTLQSLQSTEMLSTADAVRSLGLLRWGVTAGVTPGLTLRQIDYALCVVEFRAGNDPRIRAENLRHDLNLA